MAKSSGANQTQLLKIGGAVIVFGVAVFLGIRAMTPAPTTTPNAYYYDVASGQLTVARKGGIPPFNLPPEGLVQAMVFSCGDCANESERFIGWVESYNDEALAKLRAASGKQLDPAAEGELRFETQLMRNVAPPPQEGGKLEWVPMEDPRAANLQMQVTQSCPQGDGGPQTAKSCVPDA